jgi:hypothetical protein
MSLQTASQSLTIKIDSTLPVVTASNSVGRPKGGQARIVVSGVITDTLSGVTARSGRYSVHDTNGKVFVMNARFKIAANGTTRFAVLLPQILIPDVRYEVVFRRATWQETWASR